MAFSGLMLTTDGKILFAKAQQGKPLHITRVGLGDGMLPDGSLTNRTALISERLSLLIDGIQLIEGGTTAAVIATLSNQDLQAGFYYREVGLFATDPDSQEEKLYLYDNASPDGEYINDGASGVKIFERLKFQIKAQGTANITFAESGNPINITYDDIGVPGGVAAQNDLSALEEGYDCGYFTDAAAVVAHDNTATAHPNLRIDGNAVEAVREASLEAHIANPGAHQNLEIDGNGQ